MRRHAHTPNHGAANRLGRWLRILLIAGCFGLVPGSGPAAGESAAPMSLRTAVETAIDANLDLMTTGQEIEAAQYNRKVQKTNLLPTFNASYRGVRNNSGVSGFAAGAVTGVGNTYTLTTGLSQPLFQGFALVNQVKIAELGVDAARMNRQFTRLEVIFQIKQAYFNVLKAEKLLDVARNTAEVLAAQEEVARNFYDVGMTPLNDLLQVRVQLANARQALITAQNGLDTAQSQFNVILRRPVNAPVNLVDIQTFQPLDHELDYYLDLAVRDRLDIKVAGLNVQVSEKEVDIARSGYFPTITFDASYFRSSTDWALSDTERFANPDGWSLTGIASWDFWQWGRTKFNTSERRRRLAQTKIAREKTIDQARLEVEVSYLQAREAEKNIQAVEKAVEQAKENLRITNERYKEQVATSVDTLVAQNLLTSTQVNYFSALYNFKIAKAFLQRAVNLELLE
ncbi:MAG: TolC family protein [Desulfobacterales bacterium]